MKKLTHLLTSYFPTATPLNILNNFFSNMMFPNPLFMFYREVENCGCSVVLKTPGTSRMLQLPVSGNRPRPHECTLEISLTNFGKILQKIFPFLHYKVKISYDISKCYNYFCNRMCTLLKMNHQDS